MRCEELQDEFRELLANWRTWPEDGRCDDSVRALCFLLAAVDAAPFDLEVRELAAVGSSGGATLCASKGAL